MATSPVRLSPMWGLLESACSVAGPKTSWLRFASLQLSAADVRARAQVVAGSLASMGIDRRSHVAVMLPNGPEYVETIFAIACLGAVEVPVNTALVGSYLAHVLRDSDAELVVVHHQWVATLEAAAREGQVSVRLVVVGSSADELPEDAVSWEVITQGEMHPEPAEVSVRDPACILYTSGTTGASKGVVLSHGYFHQHALLKLRVLEINADDTLYTCLPFFHVNARVNSLLPSLIVGCPLYVATRFSLSSFWDEIRVSGATVFTLIGSIAQLLLNAAPSSRDRAHSARLAFGGPVPPDRVVEFEQRFGVDNSMGYGLTEAMSVMYRPPGGPVDGCGRPLPEFDVQITDEESFPVETGVVGELLVRPRQPHLVMQEYYRNPEATVAAWQDLWLHTGDAVSRNDDGEYFFVGRIKDAIRRRGENISAAELEATVCRHPDVHDCAAIGVPSEWTEEDVKLVVVRSPTSTLREPDLAEQLQPSLPRFAWPRYVEFVPQLPMTATMRIEKYRLKEAWASPSTWDVERGRFLPPRPEEASHP